MSSCRPVCPCRGCRWWVGSSVSFGGGCRLWWCLGTAFWCLGGAVLLLHTLIRLPRLIAHIEFQVYAERRQVVFHFSRWFLSRDVFVSVYHRPDSCLWGIRSAPALGIRIVRDRSISDPRSDSSSFPTALPTLRPYSSLPFKPQHCVRWCPNFPQKSQRTIIGVRCRDGGY